MYPLFILSLFFLFSTTHSQCKDLDTSSELAVEMRFAMTEKSRVPFLSQKVFAVKLKTLKELENTPIWIKILQNDDPKTEKELLFMSKYKDQPDFYSFLPKYFDCYTSKTVTMVLTEPFSENLLQSKSSGKISSMKDFVSVFLDLSTSIFAMNLHAHVNCKVGWKDFLFSPESNSFKLFDFSMNHILRKEHCAKNHEGTSPPELFWETWPTAAKSTVFRKNHDIYALGLMMSDAFDDDLSVLNENKKLRHNTVEEVKKVADGTKATAEKAFEKIKERFDSPTEKFVFEKVKDLALEMLEDDPFNRPQVKYVVGLLSVLKKIIELSEKNVICEEEFEEFLILLKLKFAKTEIIDANGLKQAIAEVEKVDKYVKFFR